MRESGTWREVLPLGRSGLVGTWWPGAPVPVSPEDGLAVEKQDPWGALLCARVDPRLAGSQASASSVEVCEDSGGCLSGPEMSVGLRSTTGSWLVPWDFLTCCQALCSQGSSRDCRQASDPTSRFAPFPFRSQEVATSSLFLVVVPGPNSGAHPSLSEILHLESDVLCHSQDNDFHYMAPPNIESCRIWFTPIARLWRWQLIVASFADTPMEPCSAPAISHRATRGQWVAAYGKHCKEILLVIPKGNQSWIFIGRTEAEAETPIHLPPDAKNQLIGKHPDAREYWRWKQQGDDRGWDGWMASLTQWTWVCVASGSRWWTGKPGGLQSMGLQRVRHHWATELTDCPIQKSPFQGKLPQNMFDKLKRISLKYIDILFISSFIWKLMKSHYKEHM